MTIDSLRSHYCATALCCLVQCGLCAETANHIAQREWRERSYANLKHISFVVDLSTDEPIERLLACDKAEGKPVRQVSAEKVFTAALKKAHLPEHLLVHSAYRRKVKPMDPDAESEVDRWGSSYTTWWMCSDKWKLAKEFWWYHNGRDLALPFPILWDKNPQFCGELTHVLTIQGTTYPVPVEKLDAYLEAASQWVQPRKQPLKEVLGMLRSDAVEKRIWAVRLLGARKEAEHIPAIARLLKDPHLEVRFAAAWALGMIGDPAAIPYLEADLRENPGSPRGDIASALGQIGGAGAIEPLARLLKDRNATVRKRAAGSMAATGSEKAIPHLVEALGDKEKAVREAALESLMKLGWQPPKKSKSGSTSTMTSGT